MIRIFALAAALMAPLPALALSCAPFGPIDAFNSANAAPEQYFVIHGALEFDASKRPEAAGDGSREVAVPGWVRGNYLRSDGFTGPVSVPVTLNFSCFGSWCGYVEPSNDILLFVKKTASGYSVDIGLCNAMAFANPSSQDLRAMKSCVAGACP